MVINIERRRLSQLNEVIRIMSKLQRTSKIPGVIVHPENEWPTVKLVEKRLGKWSGDFHTTQKSVSRERVQYFVDKLEAKENVNPVEVFVKDKQIWLFDGHHRVAAFRKVQPDKPVPVRVYKRDSSGDFIRPPKFVRMKENNLKKLLNELLAEEISTAAREQIATANPNDVLTVYHGTPKFRLPLLINGFDATQDFARDYRSGKHPGIFITADFELSKRFGGGAVIEIKVKAKNIHGTNWSGTIGRELKKQGEPMANLEKGYPESFRPFMAYTMLSSSEPQGLLLGVVKPSQITRVWIKNLQTKEWEEYTREEFLKSGLTFSGTSGSEEFGEAGIDMSDPNMKLEDFMRALLKAEGMEDRFERSMQFMKARAKNPEGLKSWLDRMEIKGSKLGKQAQASLFKQVMAMLDESAMPLEGLLSYLLEGATKTDHVIQKALKDWVEDGKKSPEGPHWFPPKELFKYREYLRRDRPDLKKSMTKKGFDPKYPIWLNFGQNGEVKIGEGNHRLKTAIQLGLDKIPVVFHFDKYVIKNAEARDIWQMKQDKELARKKSIEAQKAAFDRKYGVDKAREEMEKERQEKLAAMTPEERAQEESEKQKAVDDLMGLLGF